MREGRISDEVQYDPNGAGIVVTSFAHAVSSSTSTTLRNAAVHPTSSAPPSQPAIGEPGPARISEPVWVQTSDYNGAGSAGYDREALLADARRSIANLSEAAKTLGNGSAERILLLNAIDDAKLALVTNVWQSKWGDVHDFRKRVREGDTASLPASFVAAYTLLRTGQDEPPR